MAMLEASEGLPTSAANPAAPFLYIAAIEQVGQLDQIEIVIVLWRTLSMKGGIILWRIIVDMLFMAHLIRHQTRCGETRS